MKLDEVNIAGGGIIAIIIIVTVMAIVNRPKYPIHIHDTETISTETRKPTRTYAEMCSDSAEYWYNKASLLYENRPSTYDDEYIAFALKWIDYSKKANEWVLKWCDIKLNKTQ